MTHKGILWVAMEYVDGTSLTEVVENNIGTFSEPLIAAITAKVRFSLFSQFLIVRFWKVYISYMLITSFIVT
jgi:serine/threonine protein kinase